MLKIIVFVKTIAVVIILIILYVQLGRSSEVKTLSSRQAKIPRWRPELNTGVDVLSSFI